MAKQELSWINVNASDLSGDMLKAWVTLNNARAAFKAVVIAQGRKAKAIGPNDDLIINVKPWGFGMAKAPNKVRNATNGNIFGELA